MTLLGQSLTNDYWGYVLAAGQHQSWRACAAWWATCPSGSPTSATRETERSVVVEIFDARTGQVDVTLQTRKLAGLSSKVSMVRNSFTNVDRQGRLTTGYAVSRDLRHASSADAGSVALTLTAGSLSTYIKALKLGKLLRYDYVPEFQSALYAPQPL